MVWSSKSNSKCTTHVQNQRITACTHDHKGKPREGHGTNIIPEEPIKSGYIIPEQPIKSGIRILPTHLLKKVYSLLFLTKVKSLKLVDSASIFAVLGTIKRLLYWARIG